MMCIAQPLNTIHPDPASLRHVCYNANPLLPCQLSRFLLYLMHLINVFILGKVYSKVWEN